MATTKNLFYINQDELCELLDVDKQGLRKLMRRHGLPKHQAMDDRDGARWRISTIRDWLMDSRYRSPRSLTLDWWPDVTEPASLVDAKLVGSLSRDGYEAVLQYWDTTSGYVVVGWDTAGRQMAGRDLAKWVPEADSYLFIGSGWKRGPQVLVWPGENPLAESADIEWRDLARVLGRPAPFWPVSLRHPELIQAWRPGDPLVRHVSTVSLDVQPLLRMALLYPTDNIVHRALVHTAQVVFNRADYSADFDLRTLSDRLSDGRLTTDDIILAAEPAPIEISELPLDLDLAITRVGWREVLRRTDYLAEQCVHTMLSWSGGEVLLWNHPVPIPRTPHGEEFLSRLEPALERTAAYVALDPDRTATPMVDPASDIPVILPASRFDHIKALAPHRLPATSPLVEIILDGPIWIRTEDGTLYPAPRDHYAGLSWGYEGSGPDTLAALAHALLNDINSPGAGVTDGAPPGLEQLFQRDWPSGTIITRHQLETARVL